MGGITGIRKANATCTSMKIKITLNDIAMPVEYIDLILREAQKCGTKYKSCQTKAQEILSVLQIICESNKTKMQSKVDVAEEQSINVADEIMKFKQLLDAGFITEKEYKTKKKQLLGL